MKQHSATCTVICIPQYIIPNMSNNTFEAMHWTDKPTTNAYQRTHVV